MLECVVNISEGRRLDVLDQLSRAAGPSLRDRHHDEFHNRSVFTLIDDRDRLRDNVRSLAAATMDLVDLRGHEGVHPRFGALDVVPFVALEDHERDVAITLRDESAAWVATSFGVPVFLYGPREGGSRTLPELRKGAFDPLVPDFGPSRPHPTRGASAVGARGLLVAWNLWLRGVTIEHGRTLALGLRRAEVRVLAFAIGEYVQISCNLIEPTIVGPSVIYDDVAADLDEGVIDHAELVGLIPGSVLQNIEKTRWAQLDLSEERTIEARIA